MVDGVGLVLGGYLTEGEIYLGQKMWLGPDSNGDFRLVQIKSLHRMCLSTNKLYKGQHATLAIKSIGAKKEQIRRSNIRKGMVLIEAVNEKGQKYNDATDSVAMKKFSTREFEAEIYVLTHSTTIRPKYTPTIHIGVVRQTAEILSIKDLNDSDKDIVLRSGTNGKVKFRFQYSPEYIRKGMPLLFREGRARGVGKITGIC